MATPQKIENLSNSQKAALLLLSMDEKSAAELLGQLGDEEIQKIGSSLLNLEQIPASQLQSTIDEFVTGFSQAPKIDLSQQTLQNIPVNGKELLQKFIQQTMPSGRAEPILGAIFNPSPIATDADKDGLRILISQFEVDELFNMIKDEHPQLIAIVLNFGKRKQVKETLQKFEPALQTEIMVRIAQLEKLSLQIIKDIEAFFQRKVDARTQSGGGESSEKGTEKKEEEVSFAGLDETVKLLKAMTKDQSLSLLSEIEKADPDLGARILKLMFTMEDLERSDDAGIRELLRGIRNEDLKIALKDCADTLKEKIFKNMSSKAALILKEDMESMGALKIEDIEAAQQNILKVAKDLIKEEKMVLSELADA